MRSILLFFSIWLVMGCQSNSYRQAGGTIYGTYYRVAYQSPVSLDQEIFQQMQSVNRSLSMFDSTSVVSRWNRGDSEYVDTLFLRMFGMAERVYRESEGAFDITVAPLSNAWGFGYKHKMMPTPAKVDSLLQYVGMCKLSRENNRIIKDRQGIEIDASSIAKGLGVDLVAEYLEAQGVKNYMVDIGGEIRVKGQSEKKRSWRIGVDRPVDDANVGERELQLVMALEDGAVATSGNYRNFYVYEGKKYAHTIDPRTGYPVQQDILSSTVYAPTCMEADAYATSFMVLGLEESKKIVEQNPEIEACFVYRDNGKTGVWMTEAFRKQVLSMD